MPPPSHRRKFPDAAHEDLAVWVEETIATATTTRSDVDDSLMLADTLFTLVDQTMSDIGSSTAESSGLQQRIATLEAQVADLTARLAVLEPAVFAPEEPTP